MKSNKHIPLRHHKVLLLQLAHEIIERVQDTGLKPSSKRAKLSTEIKNGIKKLIITFGYNEESMKSNKHIPLRHHKVLLLQLAHEIIERVQDTGLKPSSKRATLSTEIKNGIKKLEREFKRDVTLKASADAKRELFMELYEGVVPNWVLECMFGAYTEENRKLTKRAS